MKLRYAIEAAIIANVLIVPLQPPFPVSAMLGFAVGFAWTWWRLSAEARSQSSDR